jgi:hypothetical protein
MVETVKDIIENQLDIKPPLNEKYKEWKKRHGFDERILIMTGEYLDSICVIEKQEQPDVTKGQRKGRFSIGVGVRDKPHTRAKVAMVTLMKWLEHGTSKSPPRTHWRVVWERFRAEMPRNVERIRIEILRELHARTMGIKPIIQEFKI